MLNTNPPYEARTALNKRIPKWLGSLEEAAAWYEAHAHIYAGCRIVKFTKRGERVIWPKEISFV